jgi:flagellar basal body P-ring formation protein FlgA
MHEGAMKSLSMLCAALAALAATVATASQPRQDPARIQQVVEMFLRERTAGMPGDIVVQAGAVDPRLTLPACAALESFPTSGSRLIGNVTVGVRCIAPVSWMVYVPATVRVIVDVVVGVRPLGQGELIGPADLALQKADLGQLPSGVLTDPAQAVGKTATTGLMAGQPLRHDQLRSPPAVLAGQSVRVISRGHGFQVSTEGRALAAASAGQIAQVRVASGQIVSGIARPGAIVEVAF